MPINTLLERPILIVEDDPGHLALFRAMLCRLSYPVLTAHNAFQARNILRDHIPILCVLDIMMPGVNGLELLQAIRADQRLTSTKVIITTAYATRIDLNGIDLADKILTKPLTKQELVQAAKDLLYAPALTAKSS